LILALTILAAGWWWWRQTPVQRPNILFITIDTLRADRVGVYGARDLETPAFDRLAGEGVRFEHAYATAPLTLPSHVSMMSGLLPPTHTVRTNDGFHVPDQVPLVAEALRNAGYATGAVVGSFVLRGATGLRRGFAYYDDDVGADGERQGHEVEARAGAWLEQPRSTPWFLWVHFFDPHLTYDPPEPQRSRYRGRPYDGEVAYTDSQIDALLRRLASRNLLKQTAVIVTGDHGEGLGDHGELSHGALLYDPMISVPLVVRLPSGAHGGHVVTEPVSLTEIASTIRSLAGLPVGDGPPGLLAQLQPESPRPAPPVSETLYLRMLLGWSPLYSFRAGRFKVIDAPTPELYDVEADPGERRNLAATESKRTADLLSVLRRELARSAQSAVAPASRAEDSGARERLAALGYVGSSGPVKPSEPVGGPAAMDRIAVWGRIEEALALAHRGDHGGAERVFGEVLREDPENPLALKFLGARALEVGDLARAVTLNERVVAGGLHVPDALSNLMLAYAQLNRPADALRAATRALEIEPDHVAARFNRAVVLANAGQNAEAMQDLGRVLELDPEHAGARALRTRLTATPSTPDPRARAQALAASGDLAGAMRVLDEAIATQPRSSSLHDARGILRSRVGDLPGARAAFERALALDPDSIEIRERLGAVMHRAGDRRAARAQFERVLARAPDRRAPRLSLGIIDLEDGRPDRAVQRFEPITSGWEGAPQALFYLGEARMALRDRRGARQAYEACLRIASPQDPVGAEAKRRLDGLR
jgi:arylsulfatase A-like enzyme/predicted Zn-dependent protease